MKLNECDSWADVEKLIRSLLPPESILNGIAAWEEWPQHELDWLERIEAMRVSLDNTPEAATATQTGVAPTKTHEGR